MKRFVHSTVAPTVTRRAAQGAGLALAVLGGAMLGAAAVAQNANGSATTQPETQGAQPTIQMVQAKAQLDKGLDAKKAKQGEAVTAKLEESVKVSGTQELPRNTVLEGHVDQVVPSDHKSASTVTVTFDRAKLKNGQELPIKATVIAISDPAMASMPGGGAPGAAASAPSAPMSGGAGAAPGGAAGSPAGAAAPNMPTQPANGPAPGESPSQPTGSGMSTNGVPGVTLTSSIHQPASATFTSKDKNVRVPGGTQMEMALAVIPPGVQLH